MASKKKPSLRNRGERVFFLFRMITRFLFRSQNVGVLPYLTLFAFISITIGVATLIIVLSVMNGFSTTLQDQLVGIYSPIRVYPRGARSLRLDRLKEQLKEQPQVTQVIGVIEGEVLFQSGPASYSGGKILAYTDWRTDRLPVDQPTGEGIHLGSELARSLWVGEEDELTIIRPDAQRTPFGLLPAGQKVAVKGHFRSGFQDVDSALGLVSEEQARRLFNLEENLTNYAEIWIADRFRADQLKTQLEKLLDGEYRLVTWSEANPALFEALQLERTVTFIVLVLIVLVAAINILSMLILSILQRRRQIAMMMSMGATPRTILVLFLAAGMLITTAGLVAGFGIGLSGCYLMDNIFVIDLPPVYPMDSLPVQVDQFHLLAIGVVTFILGFISSLYPAWAAARIDPAEVLRYG